MTDLAEIFGLDGWLATRIEGFSYRAQQQEMAQAVGRIMDQGGVLICEAGTGTGKTFAYLVPAVMSGRKVIISTGTKNLQDQLYHRDLPVVRQSLSSPVSTALLKGRANYLCIHRLENTLLEELRLTREQVEQLQMIRGWSSATKSGDITEMTEIPEDAGIWPYVTSTTDNCLGQECSVYSKCHLMEARKRAQEADLVVINHHLLCADMALKEEGFGELLPSADCFILDEAHQLPDVAGNFFGDSVSGRQLLDLTRDTIAEYHREAKDLPEVTERAERLKQATRDMRLAFGLEQRRGAWLEVAGNPSVIAHLDGLLDALDQLSEVLRAIEGRGKGLDSCKERCDLLLQRLHSLKDGDEAESIRWFETQRQSFRLNRTPLEISNIFRSVMEERQASWVFTSATLAVGGSFEHFSNQLGLHEAETHCWDSPFDYPRQAVWYVPKGLPEPNNPEFNRAVSDLTLPILQASGGRAFLLYTSHRALQEAADYLKEKLDYPMLVQGTAPRTELVEQFRKLGNAVLLGTSSFWEGIDVRGEALSCVIIDKLPFASPGDPVLQARIDALRKRGGNPFMTFQLPQAAIALKQGAGRLIRDEKDRGVLVVCDPRLLNKPYGKIFIRSLPPMTKTQDLSVLRRFFSLSDD
ncbi:MAG: ATP-dependent DNA helicase [Candidatus Thiodiazotropha sp. (ex Lucinoma annulata)]|nr:ATP-dependent DNA helicase [Candidatus Thiodiazotropha sp. (ex Troendleina suluensis)]MCU7867229.1 ATP-dependent DNA helicase [Candidatus Thiodiazotropha sp. (ex Lucinoma borealis)]MCU7884503.1 ATP-dependent DNA helicase [Candidatus Thiodiazotropha sp. (ex Lucinoma annulata)]